MECREVGVGMERVAVAAERADREAALLDRAEQVALLRGVAEQRVGIAVRVAGIVAGAELDRLDAEGRHPVEHLLEREIGEEDCEDSELHSCGP